MNKDKGEASEATLRTMKEVCIELLGACRQKCIFCSGGDWGAEQLTPEKVKNVLLQAKSYGAKVFSISGGEPLLYRNLSEVMDYGKDLDFQLALYTSGVGKHGAIGGELANKFAENYGRNEQQFKVIFNLQGSKGQTHDRLVGVEGAFDTAMRSIRNSVREGIWVEVHFVPMSANWREILEVAEVCEGLGVKRLSPLRLMMQGRASRKNELMLTKEEFMRLQFLFLRLIEDHAKGCKKLETRLGHPIDFTFLIDPHREIKSCRGGIDAPYVQPDGTCDVCPAFKDFEQLHAGNIREKSFGEIWSASGVFKRFRHFIANEWSNIGGACSDCPYLMFCKGKCTAQRLWSYGRWDIGPDPLCFYELL